MKRPNRPCCDEATCPREEVSQLLEPGDPISERVKTAAFKIAGFCEGMPPETLRVCFSRLFEAPPECALADQFVTSYQQRRTALAANSEVQDDAPDDTSPTCDKRVDGSETIVFAGQANANQQQMCSDLVSLTLSTGQKIIGVLEKISPSGCEVTLEEPLFGACVVTLQCVDCPKGDAPCIGCHMAGAVISQQSDPPLGVVAAIEFTDATWCEERWKPRHLTNFGCGASA